MLTVGKLVLNRNPDNFFAETEQVAFHPGPRGARHRLHQRSAAAGAAVLVHRHAAVAAGRPQLPRAADQPRRLPVPQLPARRHAPHADRTRARSPTSRTRWPAAPSSASTAGSRASRASPKRSSRPRSAAAARASTTTSARRTLFWNSQSPAEKEHIIAAFQFELSKVEVPAIRQRMVDNLAHVDAKLARKVAEPLGIAPPDAKAAAGRAGLSRQARQAADGDVAGAEHGSAAAHGIATRKVAVLVANGVEIGALQGDPAGAAGRGRDQPHRRGPPGLRGNLIGPAARGGPHVAEHAFGDVRRGAGARRRGQRAGAWRATAMPCTSCWRPTSIARRSA